MISSPHTADTPSEAEPAWHRAHPAFIVTALVRNIRGLIIPIGVLLLSRGFEGGLSSLITLGLTLLVMVIAGLFGVLDWWFFRYALTPENLLVHSGVISKQERTVPYQRIQTVDLEEAPLDRLLGVAKMRIETAATGSGESEVKIQAIARDDAQDLRERLLRARQAARSGSASTPAAAPTHATTAAPDVIPAQGELIRSLSLGRLLVAGATSGTIGPAAAIVGVGLQFADDIVPNSWWNRVPWEDVGSAATSVTIVASLLIVAALFAWLLAIGGTVLTFYGFELRRDGDHLMVQYGLLDRRRTTIPIRRIQAIRIEEGMLRQPFGLAAVRYESAGQAGRDEGGSGVLFPLMPRLEITALLARACPDFAAEVDESALGRLPRRSLRRYVVADLLGTAVMVTAALLLIRAWQDGLPWWSYLVLVLFPIIAIYDWLQFHDAGWALDDRHLLMRWRSAARVTMITQRRRVQHRGTTSNPFQRRADLVTFRVAVAAGGMGGHYALAHLDRADGERLLVALGTRRDAQTASRIRSN
jgi:putative membrane protein